MDDLPALPPVTADDLDRAAYIMGVPRPLPTPAELTPAPSCASCAVLAAENARLRAALQPLADLHVDDRDHPDEVDDHLITAGEIRAARAALRTGETP